jgi:sulfite reductase (NADPH) flavoprotein alpha-component
VSGARLLLAAAVVLAYAALCLAVVLRARRRRRAAERDAAAFAPGVTGLAPTWVVHASQTGLAEALARQTARALHDAGVPVHLARLGELTRDALRGVERALFIASTSGEGDPPDSAATFARDVMGAVGDGVGLARLRYGVLALGDSRYAHYCGFGRTLDAWLQRHEARPMFERIEVDRANADALERWRGRLGQLAGTVVLPDWDVPAFEPWRLAARRLLNPGSLGDPAFQLELVPAGGGPPPGWEAGDLVQVRIDADPDHPRDYSIASIPADGRVCLVVRRSRRPDGSPGHASCWLTAQAPIGATIPLRLRANPGFRIGHNRARPLILIGNGSGIAGLRGHLRQRAAGPPDTVAAGAWLVFGERQAARDAFFRDEIEAWLAAGVLDRVDWVFSRESSHRPYVQHLLADQAGTLRERVARGAAILVCGSLRGMAPAVDEVLRAALGDGTVDRLLRDGRYRRDVY